MSSFRSIPVRKLLILVTVGEGYLSRGLPLIQDVITFNVLIKAWAFQYN